ncbi:F0F1-type ATP synthase membrane subunit b/b' [Neobacillus niacini]|nr:hypothetical protein [Neobacillus niacini]MDR7079686.1 F0F1-type ATP synthase membrane subunit b/b' [Neobacillus niacini]
MHIPWIAIIGPIVLVWIASFIVYKLIKEHIDERFEELKKWLKENR